MCGLRGTRVRACVYTLVSVGCFFIFLRGTDKSCETLLRMRSLPRRDRRFYTTCRDLPFPPALFPPHSLRRKGKAHNQRQVSIEHPSAFTRWCHSRIFLTDAWSREAVTAKRISIICYINNTLFFSPNAIILRSFSLSRALSFNFFCPLSLTSSFAALTGSFSATQKAMKHENFRRDWFTVTRRAVKALQKWKGLIHRCFCYSD